MGDAYGAALWGVQAAALEALKQQEHVEAGLAQMAGAALLAMAACRGIWRTFTKPSDGVKPAPRPPHV